MVETPPGPRGPDRGRDRRLTISGLALATGFLAAGLASLALPAGARLGNWLPLHLVLAGGAGTAIAAMAAFFAGALTVAPPAPARLRAGGIAAIATGTGLAAIGRVVWPAATNPAAAAGAAVYVMGALLVLAATLAALRGATGPRRPATELAYLVGLVEVTVGVSLAALLLAGNADVAASWAALKPAHAWLNLFGFVTLVIAGSLAHFAPTVAGSRIARRRWAAIAVSGLALGAPNVAAGYAVGADLLVRIGAVLELGGAAALVAHGLEAHRDRFAWTTDHEWHAFTSGSLVAAPMWLLAAAGITAIRVAGSGADPAGWQLPELIAPLVAGFVVQVVLGGLSHLLPAIGPGSPQQHAAQRRVLGRDGRLRLAAWNLGVAAATLGVVAGQPVIATAGAAILVTDLAATLLLLGASLRERG